MNCYCLLNEYRVKEAKHILIDKQYVDKNIEKISTLVGFANRNFYKYVRITLNAYRKKAFKGDITHLMRDKNYTIKKKSIRFNQETFIFEVL